MSARKNAKEKIAEALITLMKTKDIGEITVKELIAQAKVNRSTYYYYFYRIEEVMEYIIGNFLEEMAKVVAHDRDVVLDGSNEEFSYIEDKTVLFYKFVLAHLEEYKVIIKSKYKDDFYGKIVKVMQEHYKKYEYFYEENGEVTRLSEVERQYWYREATWCFIGVLEGWAERMFEETPEELIKLSYKLFGSMKKVIIRIR